MMKNRGPDGRPTRYLLLGDYTNPILKPQAAEIVKKHGEIEDGGAHALTPRTECWPTGVPLILENTSMQIIEQRDEITILYSETYDRSVELDHYLAAPVPRAATRPRQVPQ